MDHNAYGAYERTCYVYANHEKPVSDMLYSGMAVLPNDNLMYSCTVKEHFMLLKKSTDAFTSVYILL